MSIDGTHPAFPMLRLKTSFSPQHQFDGLTIRDYAAIQFAAAILANPAHHEYLHSHDERNAIAFYAADSWLRNRPA